MSYQPNQGGSLFSNYSMSSSRKREVLWNVLEPGDPYDIKKSMIAKFPGDKKIFMGDHLEMVCLFQAAEIERLCEFLDDYKLKYREVQRRELDRHSYEVQIKELTQQIADQNSYRNQNIKLKDFVKKQTAEIQYLQKNTRGMDESFKVNYDKALRQMESLRLENASLKENADSLYTQFQHSSTKYQALERAKNKEIEQIQLKYSQLSRSSYENQIQNLKFSYENQIKRLDNELRRQKDIHESKNIEIEAFQRNFQALEFEYHSLKSKGENVFNLERQIVEYENKFVIFGQQIERLNIVIKDVTNKLQESEHKRRDAQRKYQRLQFESKDSSSKLRSSLNEIQHFKQIISKSEIELSKLSESKRYLSQYEFKIQELNTEIDKLNIKIKSEVEGSNKYREDAQRLSFENSRVKIIEKENIELKETLIQFNNYKRKVAEQENKIMLLTHQIQRLNYAIKNNTADGEKIRALSVDNQDLRRKVQQTEYTLRSTYQAELIRRVTEYEQRIQYINKTTGNQFQGKLNLISRELQQLQEINKKKIQENQQLRRRINEIESNSNKSEYENSRKHTVYETTITNYKRQNEDLNKRARELIETQRKLTEYESKFVLSSNQIDRLSNILRNKDIESENLRSKIKEVETSIVNKYEMDVSRRVTTYEQNLGNLQLQNQEYRVKFAQFQQQYARKIAEYQSKIGLFSQENQQSKRKLQDYQRKIQDYQRKIQEYQSKFTQLSQQFEKLNQAYRNLSQENENLKRQLSETKNNVNSYEYEVSRKVTTYEQNLTGLGRENEDLKRKIVDNESRIALMSQQIQRLNSNLKSKHEEASKLDSTVRNSSLENENLKRLYQELEYKVKNTYEVQVSRKYTIYETNLSNLARENEELKRINKEYEKRLITYSQQFEKLNETLKGLSMENENLKRQLQQHNISVTNFEGEANRRLQTYQQNIQLATKENQQLRRKINDLVNQSNKKISDYENRAAITAQEIERLNQTLKNLSVENETIRNQLKQLEYSVQQKLEGEVSRKYQTYQQNIITLNTANQELRRRIQQFADINRKFVDSQNKVQQLRAENQHAKQQLSAHQQNYIHFQSEATKRINIYQQNIHALTRENEEFRRRFQEMGDVGKKNMELENKIVLLSQEIQRLNVNSKGLRQENDNLKKIHSETKTSVSNYEMEITRRVTSYEQNINNFRVENEELKRRLAESEGKIAILSQELERASAFLKNKSEESHKLDSNLRNYAQENEALRRQIKDIEIEVNKRYGIYQQNITALTKETQELRKRLQEVGGDAGRKLSDYENKFVLVNQEIERLNQNLRGKTEELNKSENRLRTLMQELENAKRQYQELEQSVSHKFQYEVSRKYTTYQENITVLNRQNDAFKRRIAEDQNKIALMSQEIERLNNLLRLKLEENNKINLNIRSIANQNEELKQRLKEYESNLSQNMQNLKRQNEELRRILQEYEGKLKQVSIEYEKLILQVREYDAAFKGKSQESAYLETNVRNYQAEIENLKRHNKELQLSLRNYQAEIENLKRHNKELQLSLTQRLEYQIRNRDQAYQIKVTTLSREHEELKRRFNQVGGDSNRKISEYENKIAILNQENQRLNSILKIKVQELNKYDLTYKGLANQYEMFKRQQRDNEVTINNRYQLEINKRVTTFEQNVTVLTRENQELRRRVNDLGDLNRKLTEYQSRIALLAQQNQRLSQALRAKAEEYGHSELRLRQFSQQIDNYKRQISEYEVISRKITVQGSNSLRQNEDLKRKLQELDLFSKNKIAEYENKIMILNQEMQRLSQTIRAKHEESEKVREQLAGLKRSAQQRLQSNESELGQLHNSYTLVTKEYENSKKHLLEYEQSIRKLYTEFERLQNIINQLKKERESLFEKNHALSDQIERLNRENQDLEEQTRDVRLRLTDQTALQKRINEHMALMVVLFAEIESLRKRVKDKEKQVQEVRRSSLAPFKV